MNFCANNRLLSKRISNKGGRRGTVQGAHDMQHASLVQRVSGQLTLVPRSNKTCNAMLNRAIRSILNLEIPPSGREGRILLPFPRRQILGEVVIKAGTSGR